jgi:hypothetical protein
MTKLTFVAAALVVAAAYTSEASAARKHTQATTSTAVDCVRAPNVGAFASAPYSVPPCMPGTIN